VDKPGENHRRIRCRTNSFSSLAEMPKHEASKQAIENKHHFLVIRAELRLAGTLGRPFYVEPLSVGTNWRASSETSRVMVDHASQ
jgi:hypothetical protein